MSVAELARVRGNVRRGTELWRVRLDPREKNADYTSCRITLPVQISNGRPNGSLMI
jgi:hypothetical protein